MHRPPARVDNKKQKSVEPSNSALKWSNACLRCSSRIKPSRRWEKESVLQNKFQRRKKKMRNQLLSEPFKMTHLSHKDPHPFPRPSSSQNQMIKNFTPQPSVLDNHKPTHACKKPAQFLKIPLLPHKQSLTYAHAATRTRTHASTHTQTHTPEIQVQIPSRTMGTFFRHTISSIFRLSLTRLV